MSIRLSSYESQMISSSTSISSASTSQHERLKRILALTKYFAWTSFPPIPITSTRERS
jgi:hypothetical protein